MKHFSDKEWQLFRRDEYPEEKSRLMEEHLQECPKCMDMFLNSINEREIIETQKAIPTDFTDTVIKMINSERKAPMPPKRSIRWVKKSQNLLAYYAAAAVLTIALMGGGAFQAFVKNSTNVGGTTRLNSQIIEQKLDTQFSKKIVEQTHQLIIRIENQKQEEVR
jgi:predicted anti-sigma-YlaC factor YlaD